MGDVIPINSDINYQILVVNGVSIPIIPENWVLINGIWRHI